MRLHLAYQPDEGGYDVCDYLHGVATDGALERLTIVVAWAKASGMRVAAPSLERFRRRGGRVRMVVGVSQGGATRDGLRAVHATADEAYVFHHRGARTFHPKVYFATGDDRLDCLVGSSNLTRGGTVENFECSLRVDGVPSEDVGVASLRDDLEAYWARLIGDPGLCVPLTASTLAELFADETLDIRDEVVRTSRDRRSRSDTPPELFPGPSSHGLRHAPSPRLGRIPPAAPGGSTDGAEVVGSDVPHGSGDDGVLHRWFKKMAKSDAQRPDSGSHPTGHLTLVRAHLPIEPEHYFPEVFFSSEDWTPVPGEDRVQAQVPFDVRVYGSSRGRHTLLVDYKPSFGSGQKNRTVTLRWGDSLSQYLRSEQNHVGDYATLEKRSGAPYLLDISPEPLGPFA